MKSTFGANTIIYPWAHCGSSIFSISGLADRPLPSSWALLFEEQIGDGAWLDADSAVGSEHNIPATCHHFTHVIMNEVALRMSGYSATNN